MWGPGRMSILLFWLLQLAYIDDLGVSHFRREVDVDGRFASFFLQLFCYINIGKREAKGFGLMIDMYCFMHVGDDDGDGDHVMVTKVDTVLVDQSHSWICFFSSLCGHGQTDHAE